MNAVFNLHFSLQNPKRKSKKNEDLVMKDGFHCSHMIKIETNEMLRELREREKQPFLLLCLLCVYFSFFLPVCVGLRVFPQFTPSDLQQYESKKVKWT